MSSPVVIPAEERFAQTPRVSASWFVECKSEAEEWLIDGLIGRASYTGIFGRRGSGKSFFGIEMVACGALGKPFLGRECERFGSVYCVGEKKARFGKRVEAWRISRGVERLAVQFRWGVPNLLDETEVGDFIAELLGLRSAFASRGAPLAMVVLDTLSRSLKGANVSDADAAGTAINAIQRIIDETGLAVCPMAHMAKAEGSTSQKGAGEWEDAADSLIRIERPEDGALRVVTLTKQSDEADRLEMGFELETVHVGTSPKGRSVTSCVVRTVDAPLSNARAAKLSSGATIASEALAYLVDNGLTVEAPAKVVRDAGLKVGQRVVEVDRWKARAIELGLCDREDSDTNRRQKWHVAKTGLIKARLVRIEGDHAIPLGALGGVRP